MRKKELSYVLNPNYQIFSNNIMITILIGQHLSQFSLVEWQEVKKPLKVK